MQPTQTTPLQEASPVPTPQTPPPPLPIRPSSTYPVQPTPQSAPYMTPSTGYVPMGYEERVQQRVERRSRYQAAGVPIWGVLLVLVGLVALFGNLGIGLGWIFGLALGSWFVYLGLRHVQESQTVNWWLVGLGLLIGLGAISTGFLDRLVFPFVLVLVGAGILIEHYLSGQAKSRV